MIYTVTLNPALDYNIYLDEVNIGSVNRGKAGKLTFGGKGINVSYVLTQLGVPNTALGFIAGYTGDELQRLVTEAGIESEFIRLKNGNTRINVKLHDGNRLDTDINTEGTGVSDKAMEKLLNRLNKVENDDTVVIAGRFPASMKKNLFVKLMEPLTGSGRHVRLVLDTEKKNLTNSLKFKPFLIKPNIHELSDIYGHSITDICEVESRARELQQLGAANVIVSMGADGAFLLDEFGNTHFRAAFPGTPVSTVGAGDSMIAGFLAGLNRNPNGYEDALLLGTAAGAAAAFSEGLAEWEEIDRLVENA